MIKDLSKFSFLLFLSLTLVMTSCDDDDDEAPTPTPTGPSMNIAEIAQSNDQYSILVDALVATDLVVVLEGDGPFTVFAPDNDAFNAFFNERGINDDNADGSRVDEAAEALGDTITDILLYHVVGAEIPASAVTAKTYVATSSTFSPSNDALSLLAEPANNTVSINGGMGKGATVSVADIIATNGVIHEVDGVLELPDVVDHAIFNSDLSELVAKVIEADLVGALRMGTEFTVFAPENQAFFDNQATVDGLAPSQLSEVLLYHVLPEQFRASAITDGDQPTLFVPQSVELVLGADAQDNPVVTIIDADPNSEISTVIATDIQATNGVVHVIDNILIPEL